MFVNFDRSEQLKSNHHCNQSISLLFFFNLVSSREAFHLVHHALREFCNFAQQTVKQLVWKVEIFPRLLLERWSWITKTRKLYNNVTKKVSNNDTIKFVDVLNNSLHSLWAWNFSGYFPIWLCGKHKNVSYTVSYSCSITNVANTNHWTNIKYD